jgi:hypothetical protein
MLIFVFVGDQFIPEFRDEFDDKFLLDANNPYKKTGELWRVKYSDSSMSYVVQGRLMDVNGTDEMY